MRKKFSIQELHEHAILHNQAINTVRATNPDPSSPSQSMITMDCGFKEKGTLRGNNRKKK